MLVAFVQARMSSSRLPGKVLMDLAEVPVLQRVVEAVSAAPGVDRTAVLTSEDPSDNPIAEWCALAGVTCHRGPLKDVLSRFAMAARAEGLVDTDGVLRITADCPLLDSTVCAMVVRLWRNTAADYAHNISPRSWPDGLDCEVFSAAALYCAAEEATSTFDREHVGPFIMRNRHRFAQVNLTCPFGQYGHLRWTLDTQADKEFIERLLAAAGGETSMLALLELVDNDPTLQHTADALTKSDASAVPLEVAPSSAGYARSNALLERTQRTIPLGSQTFSKSHIQYPGGRAPLFLSHGRDARVWDVDGNEYVDLVNGLLPVVLGYCDPDVDEAIRRQLDRGISFSTGTELEAELAERLVRLIPCAEMVRFGKNGSDATTGAVRLARAVTGRERVAICGYHGWHDWYIGTTSRNKGVPGAAARLTSAFGYNDAASLEALIDAHPGEFAAVVMEVANATPPEPGFLEAVRTLTEKHGIVLVFDEIITGFRYALGGAQAYFGVTPDLACFGKGMANGMPLSAVVGRADLMRMMEEIFFSSTFGGEALSLAASIATVDKLEREDGIGKLWRAGRSIAERIEPRIRHYGLSETFRLIGYDPWRILAITDHPRARKEAVRTRLAIELLDRGVLVGGGHNVSASLTDGDIDQVAGAYEAALRILAEQLDGNGLEDNLPCPAIEPVFKVR